ncbi:MAG: hypothetical protein KA436_02755 [Oligoflexales bacterium]|nr:hypothetical protein [Oligoflexales bacterium]
MKNLEATPLLLSTTPNRRKEFQNALISSCLCLFTIVGCSQPLKKISDPISAAKKTVTIKEQTELHSESGLNIWQMGDTLPEELLVPSSLVQTSEVRKDYVELRAGPGSAYPLEKRLLNKGEKLVLLSRIGSWRKVLALRDHEKGWAHIKTLGPGHSKETLTIRTKDLPTVYTKKLISTVQAYTKDREPLSVVIPKGTTLGCFQKFSNRVLVWVPSTNSVAWIAAEDIQ